MEKYFILNQERSTPSRLVWWRPCKMGYTDDLRQAGQYSEEETRAITSNPHSKERAFEVEHTMNASRLIPDIFIEKNFFVDKG